ncbi:MAG: RNA-dependent DNA polymerase [Gammaproteobacteria bacterium]|nr:RNA-dependent DNA polymerase [Gammaproteobacteria bacterium]MBU1654493.1 RNA-dependent DNA polymerase [Gammaproteobacteria bacterium]MBU1960680.1 RNA-dependent DNA polymerase [Gammaproteobacteria bacterium]
MPKRRADLFGDIARFSALHAAARRAVRGKRGKPGAAAFMANQERELLRLERQLTDGTWRPGRYVEIPIRDPKPRLVSAAPFRDRVVHHALCAVLAPIWERGFIDDSYANRAGFGTHRAIARYEQYRDRYRHVLRADIFRFFPAIDHAILKATFRRRIACENTLWLLDAIVDGSNPQEPVNLYFPGDDLFTPFERRRGLPIGNLTSQWFANLYLDGFDHFVKEVLRAPYLRYVDDIALFHDDPAVLASWRERIETYLVGRRLKLHPVKSFIASTTEPATFLGFVLCGDGRRRLPEEAVRRFRNRLRGLRDRWRAGTVAASEVQQRLFSWIAHAEHADTRRLRHALFRGGWFDPLWEPDGPPVEPVLRGGSWNNKPRNVRSAKRNRNDPTNRNNNTGFRLASTPSHARAGASKDAPGAREGIHGPS